MRRAAIILALMLAVLPAARPGTLAAQERLRLFTLGSGDVTGTYFAAANALCTSVNRANPFVLRCSPEPTSGSLYNLSMLAAGELDFAIVQADWHRIAYEGGGPVASGVPLSEMRSVMGLYPEMITIVARRDAGITRVEDLAGKRLDIGQPGSGRNASLSRLLPALGLEREHLAMLEELPAASAYGELCAGRIDATIIITGHPNPALARVLADCDAVIVPFAGSPAVSAAVAENPALLPAVILRGTYPGQEADVLTRAVNATIVTRADVDPLIVRSFVTAVLDDLHAIGVRVPVLEDLSPEVMRADGLTAPLHPGAEAAFDAAAE